MDENLSPKLVSLLADLFPGSAHVHECGMGSSSDAAIWEFAGKNDFTIVSKDVDFQELAFLRSQPPRVIWLRTGNCSTQDIEEILRSSSAAVEHFATNTASSLLILP